MNIAPVSASALSTAVQGASGSQADAPVIVRLKVSALASEVEGNNIDAAQGEAYPAELQQRVDELNAAMKLHATSIEFSVGDESGRTIVKVVDTDTVLRQYPSKELLAISRQIDKFLGMFIKTQA